MKNFKRFLVIAIVLAAAFALMVIPAEAVTGFTGSASDSGSGLGIHWQVSLIADGQNLTARLYISKNPSGYVPVDLSGELELTIVPNSGVEKTYEASSENYGEDSLTVLKTVDISGMDINHVTCVFTPNGEDPVTIHLYA